MSMQLGDRVKDRLNGFAGVIVGTTDFINGCRQHLVKPEELDKDGKVKDGIWLDEQHLELVTVGVLPNPFANGAAPTQGGPDRTSRPVR